MPIRASSLLLPKRMFPINSGPINGAGQLGEENWLPAPIINQAGKSDRRKFIHCHIMAAYSKFFKFRKASLNHIIWGRYSREGTMSRLAHLFLHILLLSAILSLLGQAVMAQPGSPGGPIYLPLVVAGSQPTVSSL